MGARDGAVGWGTALQTSSIPDGVTGIFHWHNLSDRTMALGLAQPLTEMSARNISWEVKARVSEADNRTTLTLRLPD